MILRNWFGTMSLHENVLAPTTRPPPRSKSQTIGTKLPTIQHIFTRRPKWIHVIWSSL